MRGSLLPVAIGGLVLLTAVPALARPSTVLAAANAVTTLTIDTRDTGVDLGLPRHGDGEDSAKTPYRGEDRSDAPQAMQGERSGTGAGDANSGEGAVNAGSDAARAARREAATGSGVDHPIAAGDPDTGGRTAGLPALSPDPAQGAADGEATNTDAATAAAAAAASRNVNGTGVSGSIRH
jgi:hypothetical protein